MQVSTQITRGSLVKALRKYAKIVTKEVDLKALREEAFKEAYRGNCVSERNEGLSRMAEKGYVITYNYNTVLVDGIELVDLNKVTMGRVYHIPKQTINICRWERKMQQVKEDLIEELNFCESELAELEDNALMIESSSQIGIEPDLARDNDMFDCDTEQRVDEEVEQQRGIDILRNEGASIDIDNGTDEISFSLGNEGDIDIVEASSQQSQPVYSLAEMLRRSSNTNLSGVEDVVIEDTPAQTNNDVEDEYFSEEAFSSCLGIKQSRTSEEGYVGHEGQVEATSILDTEEITETEEDAELEYEDDYFNDDTYRSILMLEGIDQSEDYEEEEYEEEYEEEEYEEEYEEEEYEEEYEEEEYEEEEDYEDEISVDEEDESSEVFDEEDDEDNSESFTVFDSVEEDATETVSDNANINEENVNSFSADVENDELTFVDEEDKADAKVCDDSTEMQSEVTDCEFIDEVITQEEVIIPEYEDIYFIGLCISDLVIKEPAVRVQRQVESSSIGQPSSLVKNRPPKPKQGASLSKETRGSSVLQADKGQVKLCKPNITDSVKSNRLKGQSNLDKLAVQKSEGVVEVGQMPKKSSTKSPTQSLIKPSTKFPDIKEHSSQVQSFTSSVSKLNTEKTSNNFGDKDSEPRDLREFLRKHPHCEISVVYKYFSKKEVQKALMMGKVIKKGDKLHI